MRTFCNRAPIMVRHGGHMIQRRLTVSVLAVLAIAAPTFAQKPANAPKGATAQCNDNTFSTAKTERGACSKHGGVKMWWGAGTVVAPAPVSPKTTPPPRGASPSKGGTAANASAPKGATGQCSDGSYTR